MQFLLTCQYFGLFQWSQQSLTWAYMSTASVLCHPSTWWVQALSRSYFVLLSHCQWTLASYEIVIHKCCTQSCDSLFYISLNFIGWLAFLMKFNSSICMLNVLWLISTVHNTHKKKLHKRYTLTFIYLICLFSIPVCVAKPTISVERVHWFTCMINMWSFQNKLILNVTKMHNKYTVYMFFGML